jgi:guanylate kinase
MIEKRLAKAEIEMADAPYFDKIIINDDLSKAKEELDREIANWTK